MGISNPDVGYDGYWANDTVIVEDLTEYFVYDTAWVEVITGAILVDISTSSKLRFKVSIKHATGSSTMKFRLLIGNKVLWEKETTNTSYQNYSTDLPVTWKRGDSISGQISLTAHSGTGGNEKDFKICGYITPLQLA